LFSVHCSGRESVGNSLFHSSFDVGRSMFDVHVLCVEVQISNMFG
jgi:hypothetical protein